MQAAGPLVASHSPGRSPKRSGKAAILSVSAHLGLLIVFDLDRHLLLTLVLIGVGFAGMVVAERQLRYLLPADALWTCLLVALVLRALLLPLPPSLSGDVLRYLWDGRVVAAGFNPYALAPDAVELVPLRDELWEQLDHRQVPTVYPPLAQGLFVVAAWLPKPLLGLKSILMSLDLGSCALLWVLARRWRLPAERTIWYAWNPLVTLEITGMGHVDGLGVVLVILTTVLLTFRPPKLAHAVSTAAGAILAKLVPLLAVPVWARQSRRPWLFSTLLVLLSTAGLLPTFSSTGGVTPGLVRYGVSWEFNGPLFEPLWRLLALVRIDVAGEWALNRLKELGEFHGFWNQLYPLNYPQLWAKLVLAAGLLVALASAWRAASPLVALRRVFGSAIVFSAVVYPWYALWVLPWAALSRQRAWLSLSFLLFLSYLPQEMNVAIFPWILISIWLPFAVLVLKDR